VMMPQQRERIKAAEMKLMWSLVWYTLYDHNYEEIRTSILWLLTVNQFEHVLWMNLNQTPCNFRKTWETMEGPILNLEMKQAKWPKPWYYWWQNITCLFWHVGEALVWTRRDLSTNSKDEVSVEY
jgi:hypothetical protein